MATKLRITVTKEILERSKMCGVVTDDIATNCAIALAVRDIFPNAFVESEVMYFEVDEVGNLAAPWISLPDEASRFIKRFDEAKTTERVQMEEFSFEIEVPESIIERINIDELKPLLENHPTLQLV